MFALRPELLWETFQVRWPAVCTTRPPGAHLFVGCMPIFHGHAEINIVGFVRMWLLEWQATLAQIYRIMMRSACQAHNQDAVCTAASGLVEALLGSLRHECVFRAGMSLLVKRQEATDYIDLSMLVWLFDSATQHTSPANMLAVLRVMDFVHGCAHSVIM